MTNGIYYLINHQWECTKGDISPWHNDGTVGSVDRSQLWGPYAYYLCSLFQIFPVNRWVSYALPGCLQTATYTMLRCKCMCPTIHWSREFSCLVFSIPGTDSKFTASLTRVKRLLKNDEWAFHHVKGFSLHHHILRHLYLNRTETHHCNKTKNTRRWEIIRI